MCACVAAPGGWDLASLEARHPQVAEVFGHQLQDAAPYFAPAKGGLALILCRWSTAAPIPVWLPPYASSDETHAIGLALAAWEGAGLGLRFVTQTWTDAPPLSGIVFEILDLRRAGPSGAADTIADCAVPVQVAAPSPGAAPVDAALEFASVHLRRELRNEIGRPVPLTETELLGAVIHELGHALGFPGHVVRPGSVMSAHGQVDTARRWGARIQEGEVLDAPTLRALYATPSGVRVGWLPLGGSQALPIATVSSLAAGSGLTGPWVRVGSESARILWRHPKGQSVAVVIGSWRATLREPSRFEARLTRLARMMVEQATR